MIWLQTIVLLFAPYTDTLFSNHGGMLWTTLVVIDTMGRKGWDAMGGVLT